MPWPLAAEIRKVFRTQAFRQRVWGCSQAHASPYHRSSSPPRDLIWSLPTNRKGSPSSLPRSRSRTTPMRWGHFLVFDGKSQIEGVRATPSDRTQWSRPPTVRVGLSKFPRIRWFWRFSLLLTFRFSFKKQYCQYKNEFPILVPPEWIEGLSSPPQNHCHRVQTSVLYCFWLFFVFCKWLNIKKL